MGPYRSPSSPSYDEEELWLRLDEALGHSLVDPSWAYSLAWSVFMDSSGFPDVRRAASELMSAVV